MKRTVLSAGDDAPDFSAIAVGSEFGSGMPVRLSDYFNDQIVLYFYPKDHAPECTEQACKLRDAWAGFGPRATLFGVSTDSPEVHKQFIDLHALPFPLISDTDERIGRAYGVRLEPARGLTSEACGTERTTFVIAPEGKIKTVLRNVNPYTHDRLLLEALYS